MSFSWKGLLGVGSGSSSSSTSSAANNASTGAVANGQGANGSTWGPDDLEEEVPLWGLENFGNTCYANSVLQALYFCRPFRDAILSTQIDALQAAAALHPPSNQRPGTAGANAAAGPSRPPTGVRPASKDGLTKVPSSPSSSSATPTAPPPPESVYTTLHKLFASVSKASDDHIAAANEEAAAAAATASTGTFSKPSALSRGSKAAKGSKKQPTRPSTAASTTTITPTQAGKKKDLGISAGPVDAAVVKAFLAAVRRQNTLFDTNAHQDAHEFLNILLNRLGDDIIEEQGRRPDGKTVIHDLFEGVLTNETRCLTCEAVSSRDECFLDLSIDIEHNSSITSCLRQFSASETLRSRNKFFCDTCSGLQEAEKRMKVRKLPAVLALHMKRFKYEESKARFIKLGYRVLFPFELRLFNTADDAEDPDRLYELFAIVVHIGAGPHHGHYVSIVKVGNKWAIFDDEAVHIIEQLDISKYFGGMPGMGSAYVLFYQAVDLDREALGLSPVVEPSRPALEAMRAKMMAAAQPSPGPTILTPSMLSPGGERPPTAGEHSSPRGLHLPLSRSPADSVSSAGAADTPQRPGSSAATTRPFSASPQPVTSPSGENSSSGGGGGGFFSRFRSESTSAYGNNNSLTQAAENSRAAVEAAVLNAGAVSGGSGSSGGAETRERKGSLLGQSGPPGSSGTGSSWRSPFRSKQSKRSGSVSEAGMGAAPALAASHHNHTQSQGQGALLGSPTKSRHDLEDGQRRSRDDDTGSASTHASSRGTGRAGLGAPAAAGAKGVRSEKSPSRLGSAVTPASPPSLHVVQPQPQLQANGLHTGAMVTTPISEAAPAGGALPVTPENEVVKASSPGKQHQHHHVVQSAAPLPPTSPRRRATSPPVSPPSSSTPTFAATATNHDQPPTATAPALSKDPSPPSATAAALPTSPSSSLVQTGAFAPVLDRPLTKKEQQRIAKESRRISASTGMPGAGFEGAGASAASSVMGVAVGGGAGGGAGQADGRAGLGKGLPGPGPTTAPTHAPAGGQQQQQQLPPLPPTPQTHQVHSAPKRRSTLSRALGLGFGKNKGGS